MTQDRIVKVDYDHAQLEIAVPEDSVSLRCPEPARLEDPARSVHEALANPIGIGPLSTLVRPGNKVTIAVDIPPRSAKPRRIIIPIVLEELARCGVPEENVTLVFAGGAYRKIPPQGQMEYLGRDLFHRFWPDRLQNHDCSQDLVYLGRSSRGDYVEHNRLIQDSDLTIYLGTITGNTWGGFSGTGAVIGLGSARSIASHHTEVIAAASSCHGDHRTQHFRKHKESIQAQIEKATGKPIFYVDVVANSAGDICATYAGHSPEINEPEWALAERLFQVPTPQADVLIIGLPYQLSYGPTDNPMAALAYITAPPRHWINKPLVRKGGVVIALGRCSGEINTDLRPSDPEVLERYDRCFRVEDLSQYVDEFLTRPDYLYKYRHCFAFHPAHSFWLLYESQWLMNHAAKVIMAGEVRPGPLRRVGIVPAQSYAEAWQIAKEVVGDNPKVVVLPHYWSHLRMQFVVE